MMLNGSTLAGLYGLLFEDSRLAQFVETECDALGIVREDIDWLRHKYREESQSETKWNGSHIELIAWLLVHVGRRAPFSPAEFEAALRAQIKTRLVLPCWVLAIPIANTIDGRLPATPVLPSDMSSRDLRAAYDGLVDHMDRRERTAMSELGLTAVTWRVGAIVEGLLDAEGEGSLYARIAQLRESLRRSTVLSLNERAFCDALDPEVADRRNVLTHLRTVKGSWTFSSAAEHAQRDPEALWSLAASLSLALTHAIAQQLWEADPPRGLFAAVQRDVDW